MPGGPPEGPPEPTGTWDDVAAKLAAARNYWLCTTRPNGRPHAAPVWGLWLDGAVVFGTDASSRKGRNLAARPSAVVHLESGDDVVVLEGTVRKLAGPDVFARVSPAYAAKYAVDLEEAGSGGALYALAPAVALTWSESDYVATATRWEFPEA